MKILKKAILTLLVASMSASMMTGCNFKKKPSEENKPGKQQVEYISELTKDNVEEVVIEYKEILSYYNDLKNNLKTINDVSKNPDLERDSIAAKDSIANGREMLSNTDTLYLTLKDAKDVLLKMYDVSYRLAENVVKEPKTYQEDLKEYDKLFKEFKEIMDNVRSAVSAVRGKVDEEKPEEDLENTENVEQEKPETEKPEIQDNKKPETDLEKPETQDNKKPEQEKPEQEKPETPVKPEPKPEPKPQPQPEPEQPSTDDGNDEGEGEAFVPSVSSLSNGIKSEIKNAGYNSGVNYKQSGGDSSQIDRVATQMFNDLEGDNPIQGSQVAEARAIFVNAFKSAYNSN